MTFGDGSIIFKADVVEAGKRQELTPLVKEVKAVIELMPSGTVSDEPTLELIALCRDHLAYKQKQTKGSDSIETEKFA